MRGRLRIPAKTARKPGAERVCLSYLPDEPGAHPARDPGVDLTDAEAGGAGKRLNLGRKAQPCKNARQRIACDVLG